MMSAAALAAFHVWLLTDHKKNSNREEPFIDHAVELSSPLSLVSSTRVLTRVGVGL